MEAYESGGLGLCLVMLLTRAALVATGSNYPATLLGSDLEGRVPVCAKG